MKSGILFPQSDDDLPCPYIHAHGHAGNESQIPILNGVSDLVCQPFLYFSLRLDQFFRSMSGEAAPVLPHFLFRRQFSHLVHSLSLIKASRINRSKLDSNLVSSSFVRLAGPFR